MTYIEFWLNIATIKLLIPAVFYMAKLCRESARQQQNRETMAKLAETLRQMADRVEKKEEKTAADRIAEINFADNRRRPLQEEPHFDTRPVADVDASSEAEKELLQALRSIK